MLFTRAQVIAALTAGLSMHGVNAIAAPIAGYNVIDLTWNITHTPGKAPELFKGTMEDAFAEATKRNPNFSRDFGLDKVSLSNKSADRRSLAKRGDTTTCSTSSTVGQGPDYANAGFISDGISYLRDVPGQPSNGPGPGACGRVSCSYNSAIWWCNNNDFTKVLPSYNSIADGAQELIDVCIVPASNSPGWNYMWFQGLLNHDDGWQVVVRGDAC